MRTARLLTPLGPLVAGATDGGLCLLEFAGRSTLDAEIGRLGRRLRCAVAPGRNRHIEQVESELAEYFAGKRTGFDVALLMPGTEFQRTVWEALRRIPYGETRSYLDVARAIGRAGAVRAVGRANADNRIPIVIPCHRVVRTDGTLGGYGGEPWRKRYLLRLEGHDRCAEPQSSMSLFGARSPVETAGE